MFGTLVPFRERTGEFLPLRRLREEMDTLFDRFFEGWMTPAEFYKPTWGWEIEEGDKEVIFHAEMPGFDLKEIELSIVGNELTVKAEHKVEEKVKEKNGHRSEHRKVERTVVLPAGVEAEKMAATFKNGILEVHVPRKPEMRPRRIEVKP